MAAPSIFSAIKKIRSLLNRDEKLKWLGITAFALLTSALEVITATIIVIFAQILNQPELGVKYFNRFGVNVSAAANQVVLYAAIVVGLVYLIKNLIAAAEIFYQNYSIQNMSYNFKNRLLHKYANEDYGQHILRNSSVGVQVVSGDAEQMFSSGMLSMAIILSESTIFIFLTALIVYMNPSLAVTVAAVTVTLGVLLSKFVLPKFYNYGQRLQNAALNSGQHLLQFFHAFKEIVILGKRDYFIDAIQVYVLSKSKTQALQSSLNALPRVVIEILFVGIFIVAISMLCFKHESPWEMMGIMGGYLYAGFRLMPGLNRIINQLNVFKATIPAIESVYREYSFIAFDGHYKDIPQLKFEKEISLNNVSFSYRNAEQSALKGINLQINKGEILGIVGETGSGKSTLVDLILGLLRPNQGEILIDHTYPVSAIQWQQHIGYVPQSVYLVDDTIAANVAFGEKVIDINRLNHAIQAAQLSKMIESLPNGVSTVVGERGIRLSGGERQRIAIARALYKEPEVLIFDEATSALDSDTESKLIDTIKQVSTNRTVIMIAHRLTTLRDCNRIIVMDKGRIKAVTDYQDIAVGISK